MDCEIPVDMSYLLAIQKIPGDTIGEKFSWIGRLALHQTLPNEDIEQFPPELLSLLRVETAVKKKRHEDITSALKCDDLIIINRAFKASWFFDGSYKEIVDVTYFCEHLFPYVSVNTRIRIVKTLAYRLKDPVFAQQMFIAVESTYGIKTAYPLFLACDATFVYDTIVKKGLVLPVKLVTKIFRKNMDLVVRFLKLLKPKQYKTERTPFAIDINKYQSFLPKLIKKRVEDFVELYETHFCCGSNNNFTLSKTCTEIFLKKAKQHLIKKPHIYIHILKLEKINEHLIEKIFPCLLPDVQKSFNTDKILVYLKYYPSNKKYELLHKSYESKYHSNLFSDIDNVTESLLELLPIEERIKQARIMLDGRSVYNCYQKHWIYYLPANEVIPDLKVLINEAGMEEKRSNLIGKIICVCKNNKDDDALSDTLTYFLNRHKNEKYSGFDSLFCYLNDYYNLRDFNEKQISLIMKIIQLFYVKNEFVSKIMFQYMAYFRLKDNMPIDELIDMFIKDNHHLDYILYSHNMEPQDKTRFFVILLNTIQKKHFKDFNEKKRTFFKIVDSIYIFNMHHNVAKNYKIIEKMTIREYPWLMDAVFEILRSEKCSLQKKMHLLLQLHEPELYRIWFSEKSLILTLKQNLQNIQENWEKYLEFSMENRYRKQVHYFIRSIRWYKDLPIKFAKRCMDCVYEKRKDKISSSITILAILLHGEAVTKLMDPFVPTETEVDTTHPNAKDNYKMVKNLSLSMRLSNPPIHLDLIIRLCVGDYLTIALMTLTNVSRRTPIPKIISSAHKMMNMRVSVRKHGLRLISLTDSVQQQIDFYQKVLSAEKHYLTQVLLDTIQKLFISNPKPETWSLYYRTVSSINPDFIEKHSNTSNILDIIFKMFYILQQDIVIPNEYIMKYFDLWLKTMDNLLETGLIMVADYIAELLSKLSKPNIFDLLSEEFTESILRRYLFGPSRVVYTKMISFTILYLLSEDEDKCITHFKVFTDIFLNAYRSNPQSLEKYNICKFHKIMHLFIDNFISRVCYRYVHSKAFIHPQVIDNLQSLFLSILSPKQDAKSYLLLVYAKKLQEVRKEFSWMKTFGLRIGQHLPKLVDIFSSLLISFMAEILQYLLNKIYPNTSSQYVDGTITVAEGLVEVGNTDTCFMAAKILLPLNSLHHKSTNWGNYWQLIKKLQEMQEPAIDTLLYDNLYCE